VNKFIKVVASVAALAPLAALAVAVNSLPSNITTLETLADKVCLIAQWLFTFLIILAVIFVIWAAFRYLTAAGDPEKVKKANHSLIYAAVAVLVAVIAKGFPYIIGNFFGSGGFTGC